ncbi:MAG: hemagglutinin protein [Flavipsychrobacter sp.]|nr:hemagglutinin protein [Flavipsychrobacter sp.]
MRYKFITHIALACISSSLLRPDVQAQKKNFDISAFSVYRRLPANTAAIEKSRKKISHVFPDWAITTDKLNGTFTDIYGTPIDIAGKTNIEQSLNCLGIKLKALGIYESEWIQTNKAEAPKANYTYFRQEIDGHPVVFSQLNFRFTKEGMLARIQMKNYGRPKSIGPTLTKEEAKQIAVKDLGNATVTAVNIKDEWCWFPLPSVSGYELRPSWNFELTAKDNSAIPIILSGYIDAINGTILFRSNKVKEGSYDLTVKGTVYKNGTLLPASLEPLPYLDLKIGFGSYNTDAAGYYSNTGILLPQNTLLSLSGPWSMVVDNPSLATPNVFNLVTIPGTTYTFPISPGCSDRHINAYYHVNKIHDFMKGYFTSFTGLDFPLTTNVDVTGSCNAFYSGSTISFFAEDATCYSFAELGDVVYHEYGHGISDLFYQSITGFGMINGSLNEACSDIWGLSITHNPILAENAYKTYGGFIRRYDMLPQVYPIDIDNGFMGYSDPHKNGEIIAGAWWDVGANIGSISTMTQLFTDVYYDVPDGPPGTEGMVYQSILIDALMADDNNSNLLDGTPHYAQIVAAFAKHGIYLEGDADLIHTELAMQKSGVPIKVKATLSIGTAKYFHDMKMSYRINDTGAWTAVAMADTTFAFTGIIPAQPAGTVVDYYFTMFDALKTPNGYFPVAYHPLLPSNQVNIPFQFVVGVNAKDTTNFEATSYPTWKIGGNTGDDATLGLWQIVYPAGFGLIGPMADHTTGFGKCLSSGDAINDTGVNNGTTSVLTPVIDISKFTAPVIEYYRWYSNDLGWYNFKNDPWVVKIRDASATTWQTVEKTYQGDNSWRRRVFPVALFFPTTTKQIQLQFFASDSILNKWGSRGQSLTMGAIDDFTIYDKKTSVGVNDVTVAKMEVFPNPADDKIEITLPAGNTGTACLYDMHGRKTAEINIYQNITSYSINTKDLAAGQYNLLLQTNSSVQSKKIAVLHN